MAKHLLLHDGKTIEIEQDTAPTEGQTITVGETDYFVTGTTHEAGKLHYSVVSPPPSSPWDDPKFKLGD